MTDGTKLVRLLVHGDIRHLENIEIRLISVFFVHGDIRHLEKRDYCI